MAKYLYPAIFDPNENGGYTATSRTCCVLLFYTPMILTSTLFGRRPSNSP